MLSRKRRYCPQEDRHAWRILCDNVRPSEISAEVYCLTAVSLTGYMRACRTPPPLFCSSWPASPSFHPWAKKSTAFLLTVRGNAVFFAEKSVEASPQFFISQGLVADLVQQVPIAVRVLVVAEREPPVAGLVLHREGRAPNLQASTQCR